MRTNPSLTLLTFLLTFLFLACVTSSYNITTRLHTLLHSPSSPCPTSSNDFINHLRKNIGCKNIYGVVGNVKDLEYTNNLVDDDEHADADTHTHTTTSSTSTSTSTSIVDDNNNNNNNNIDKISYRKLITLIFYNSATFNNDTSTPASDIMIDSKNIARITSNLPDSHLKIYNTLPSKNSSGYKNYQTLNKIVKKSLRTTPKHYLDCLVTLNDVPIDGFCGGNVWSSGKKLDFNYIIDEIEKEEMLLKHFKDNNWDVDSWKNYKPEVVRYDVGKIKRKGDRLMKDNIKNGQI